ncbi:hypothetical protein GQX74_009683 [Glossina fuscipes]|nr:hypothetical protein GQX74_009683 [Glossina fuscipes]
MTQYGSVLITVLNLTYFELYLLNADRSRTSLQLTSCDVAVANEDPEHAGVTEASKRHKCRTDEKNYIININ